MEFRFWFFACSTFGAISRVEKKSCALIRKTFSSRKGDDNLLRKMQYTYSEEALRGELLLHFFDKLISNTALGFISLFCVVTRSLISFHGNDKKIPHIFSFALEQQHSFISVIYYSRTLYYIFSIVRITSNTSRLKK